MKTKVKKGQSSSPYKSGDFYKREKSAKPVTSNKSSTTIKTPSTSTDNSKSLSGEAAHLAEQVGVEIFVFLVIEI